MSHRKHRKRLIYRTRQKIYFWLKRQFKLRNIQFNLFDSEYRNKLISRAILLGKEDMEAYLNKVFGAVPFYMNFKSRKVLRKQPDAIKLLKRIKLA